MEFTEKEHIEMNNALIDRYIMLSKRLDGFSSGDIVKYRDAVEGTKTSLLAVESLLNKSWGSDKWRDFV